VRGAIDPQIVKTINIVTQVRRMTGSFFVVGRVMQPALARPTK
jgi:hypothetical protein